MGRREGVGVLAAVLLTLAGCGDKALPVQSAPEAARTAPPAAPVPPQSTPGGSTPPSPPTTPAPGVPPGVPGRPSGQAAAPADLVVIKRWLAAITHGRIAAAADEFADGAVVVNATPPLRLRNRRERIAFNRSFPCGAEVVSASGARGYVLVTYRLTDRTGSRCDGPGGRAFGAIKVERGKMTEWYRLPDPPQAPDAGAGPVV